MKEKIFNIYKNFNLELFLIFVSNLIISYFAIKRFSNLMQYLVMDFVLWGILYFIYEFIKNKKMILNKESTINYFSFYLINLLLLIIIYIFLGIGFLKTKLLFLLLFSILLCIKKSFINKLLSKILPYLLFINVVLLFMLISPMSPLGNKNSGTDSSVFRYIGTIMKNGGIPYVDAFDHKGILIYVLNWLGVMMSDQIGIWIIEVILLTISFIFTFKLSKLFTTTFPSIITTLISFMPLVYLFQEGNLTEEFALPFIIISLYLFVKDYKKKDDISLKSAFIIGMCFGAVLLLRLNMVCAWIILSIFILVDKIIKKEFKNLFKIILYFILGLIIFILPFVVYLLVVNAFDDFIIQYLIFNFKYAVSSSNDLYKLFVNFSNSSIYLLLSIIISICFSLKNDNNKKYVITNLFFILLSLLIVISPKNNYNHYAMILIPTFIIPFALLFNSIYYYNFKFIKNDTTKCILICLIIFSCSFRHIDLISNSINQKITSEDNFYEINEIITSNSTSNDKIVVFGNSCVLYLKSNRYSNLKYIYQTPIFSVDNKLSEDFKKKINIDKPEIIIISPSNSINLNETDYEFIENEYNKIYEQGPYSIYMYINQTLE